MDKKHVIMDAHVHQAVRDRQSNFNALRDDKDQLSLQQTVELLAIAASVPPDTVRSFRSRTVKPGRPRLSR